MIGGRILRSLWEREPEKLRIAQRYLEKLYKSKNSTRKTMYCKQLENIMKFFLRDSADLTELKERHRSLNTDYARVSAKRAALQDQLLKSARIAKEANELKIRLQKERELRLRMETDYGILLHKYNDLQDKKSD